nr:DMT family transporter [Neobacillus sp. Marseille-Q6967]
MKKPIVADVSLLFVTLIWGTTFVLVQNAIELLEPFSFNGIRFLAAALLLMLWLLIFERRQLKFINLRLLLSGVFIGFWLFLGYVTQTIGLLYTTTSKAGFITGLSVVFVPLFSMFLLKQFPSRNAVFGVLTATVGLFLLTMTDVSSLNIGDGFVFICAISFALQIIFTGKFSYKYPTLLLTVIQISTVAILSIFSAFLFEDWQNSLYPKVLLSKDVLVALIITSLFATALAFLLQTNFQKYTTATRVALIFAMEPVFAAITGFYFANERLSYSALVGCLLIFAGMIFAELPASKLPALRKNKSLQS